MPITAVAPSEDRLQAELDLRASRLRPPAVVMQPAVMGAARLTRYSFSRTMIARLALQIGVEHVAIGTDAVLGWQPGALGWMRSGRWDRPASPNTAPGFPEWPSWFRGPTDFGSLAEGLDDAGFSPTERDCILGGNWLRLFGTVFG